MTLSPVLEVHRRFVTPPTTTEERDRKITQNARRRRWSLRKYAGDLVGGYVATCGKNLRPGASGVRVMYTPGGHAHLKGLMVCGNAWVCPVCATKISERRRQELRQAMEAHPELVAVMVTFTLQHGREDTLEELLTALNDATRRLKMGAPWERFKARWHVIHSVTALEVTYGHHGWHPHKHMIVWLRMPRKEVRPDEMEEWLYSRYAAYLAQNERWARGEGVGVNVRMGIPAEYLSKDAWGVAEELSKATVKKAGKGGLSPFELLELYAYSRNKELAKKRFPELAHYAENAGRLFQEYARAMKGRQMLAWSRGAREFFGLGQEKTDEELASEEHAQAVELVFLTPEAWKLILLHDIAPELLNVADGGDAGAVVNFLRPYGITWEANTT